LTASLSKLQKGRAKKITCMGNMRHLYSIFAQKLRGRYLGIPSCRWKGSVKIYLKETECYSLD
jgi:hypothetical protein